MKNQRILKIPIERKWFDMIWEGIKREEYREIKQFWTSRLYTKEGEPKDYDFILFHNGYGNDKPHMLVEFLGFHIGLGLPEWGGSREKETYALRLGNAVWKTNCNHMKEPDWDAIRYYMYPENAFAFLDKIKLAA